MESVLDSRFRNSKPGYIIIGAQKSGTTSLYQWIVQHPNVQQALRKEIHYFDRHHEKSVAWYLSHFPQSQDTGRFLLGEATPNYFFHPTAARRLSQLFPDIKLILVLRNPIERAYSHFQHNIRRNRIQGTFEKALALEEEIFSANKGQLPEVFSQTPEYWWHSYVNRGIYSRQLEIWQKYFQPEQLLIFKSEEMFRHPDRTAAKTYDFLGLKPFKGVSLTPRNCYSYPQMRPATRKKLVSFFRPFNKQLYDNPAIRFSWEAGP